MEVHKVRERLQERGLALVLTDESKDLIIKKACKDLDFGARPLRRAIENMIEDPLAEELLKGEFNGMDTITVEVTEVAGKKQLKFAASVQNAAGAAGHGCRCGRRRLHDNGLTPAVSTEKSGTEK